MGVADRNITKRTSGRLLTLLACSVWILAGCAGLHPGSGEETAKTVWKVRDQFVAVVPTEHDNGISAGVNNQPVAVAPEEIRKALASVRVLKKGKDAPERLFTETELAVLEQAASAGLHQAGPGEDLVFAVFGYHPVLLGLAKETKVTTGRMFYRDGRLNLILGIIQRDVRDNEDRRLHPFTPGSRLRPAALDGTVLPASGGDSYTLKRADWLVFDVRAGETVPPGTAKPVKPAPAAETKQASPASREATPPVGDEKMMRKSIEERLLILNDLKGKNLISDEEYRAKRLEILNEL